MPEVLQRCVASSFDLVVLAVRMVAAFAADHIEMSVIMDIIES